MVVRSIPTDWLLGLSCFLLVSLSLKAALRPSAGNKPKGSFNSNSTNSFPFWALAMNRAWLVPCNS